MSYAPWTGTSKDTGKRLFLSHDTTEFSNLRSTLLCILFWESNYFTTTVFLHLCVWDADWCWWKNSEFAVFPCLYSSHAECTCIYMLMQQAKQVLFEYSRGRGNSQQQETQTALVFLLSLAYLTYFAVLARRDLCFVYCVIWQAFSNKSGFTNVSSLVSSEAQISISVI